MSILHGKRAMAAIMAGVLLLGGAPAPKANLRVHIQVEGEGMGASQAVPVTLPESGEHIYINPLPTVSERDLSTITTADSGGRKVTVLKFNEHGTLSLNAITSQNQGKQLVVFINGEIIYAPLIDTRLSDGQMIIPRELKPEMLDMIRSEMKRQNKDKL